MDKLLRSTGDQGWLSSLERTLHSLSVISVSRLEALSIEAGSIIHEQDHAWLHLPASRSPANAAKATNHEHANKTPDERLEKRSRSDRSPFMPLSLSLSLSLSRETTYKLAPSDDSSEFGELDDSLLDSLPTDGLALDESLPSTAPKSTAAMLAADEVGAEDLSESEEVDDLPESEEFNPELAAAEIVWDNDLSESEVDPENMHDCPSKPYLHKPCPLKFFNKDEARNHCLQFHVRTDRNIPSCQCAECGLFIDEACFQPGCAWFFAKTIKGKFDCNWTLGACNSPIMRTNRLPAWVRQATTFAYIRRAAKEAPLWLEDIEML
jgi:hypothetical protein